MPDILFIKTSSLGDVIHHIPALTPSTWRDIASFGRAVLARRYDDTRSAWRCEYWFLRRPERRSHARGQVPRYEKERSLGADTIRGMPITSNLIFRRVPAAGSRNAWKTRMDAIPDDSELADTRTPKPDPAVSNT